MRVNKREIDDRIKRNRSEKYKRGRELGNKGRDACSVMVVMFLLFLYAYYHALFVCPMGSGHKCTTLFVLSLYMCK